MTPNFDRRMCDEKVHDNFAISCDFFRLNKQEITDNIL